MMEKGAFVETTVLVESLLKSSDRRKKARAKINTYQRSQLPVYAIKELKNGALRHHIWFHNKLVDTASFTRTIAAIQRNFMKPYLMGTALEALASGAELLIGSSLADAKTRKETDTALADSLRLSTRRRIDKAWKERRKLTKEVVQPLSCFAETAPTYDETTGLIEDLRRRCDLESSCCLSENLRAMPSRLEAILKAIEGKSRPEDVRRRAALHLLKNHRKRAVDDKNCLALGDAYFALNCPSDFEILTTNVKDIEPLAAALQIEVAPHKAESV